MTQVRAKLISENELKESMNYAFLWRNNQFYIVDNPYNLKKRKERDMPTIDITFWMRWCVDKQTQEMVQCYLNMLE